MEYLKRLFNIVMFLFIWIGLPVILVQCFDNPSLLHWMWVTWIPGIAVLEYLDD